MKSETLEKIAEREEKKVQRKFEYDNWIRRGGDDALIEIKQRMLTDAQSIEWRRLQRNLFRVCHNAATKPTMTVVVKKTE